MMYVYFIHYLQCPADVYKINCKGTGTFIKILFLKQKNELYVIKFELTCKYILIKIIYAL